jgi:hypothetical protein
LYLAGTRPTAGLPLHKFRGGFIVAAFEQLAAGHAISLEDFGDRLGGSSELLRAFSSAGLSFREGAQILSFAPLEPHSTARAIAIRRNFCGDREQTLALLAARLSFCKPAKSFSIAAHEKHITTRATAFWDLRGDCGRPGSATSSVLTFLAARLAVREDAGLFPITLLEDLATG